MTGPEFTGYVDKDGFHPWPDPVVADFDKATWLDPEVTTGLDLLRVDPAAMRGEPLERAAWWATIVGAGALVVIAWKIRR